MGYVVYYELNLEYVIQEYCVNKKRPKLNCDGKCYLMKKLSMANDNSNNDEKRVPKIIEIFSPLYYQSGSFNWKPFSVKKAIEPMAIKAICYNSPILNILSPPPKI